MSRVLLWNTNLTNSKVVFLGGFHGLAYLVHHGVETKDSRQVDDFCCGGSLEGCLGIKICVLSKVDVQFDPVLFQKLGGRGLLRLRVKKLQRLICTTYYDTQFQSANKKY